MKKLIIIIICIFLLTGCSKQTEEDNNIAKITSEIDYFSSQIIAILNDLNNISLNNYELISEEVKVENNSSASEEETTNSEKEESSEDNSNEDNTYKQITAMKEKSTLQLNSSEIEWNSIKNQIELINTSWSIIILDLSKANISDEDISKFGATLNNTILSIKKENKEETLINLTELYSFIPDFLITISAEKSKQVLEATKYNVLSAYTAVSINNWNIPFEKLKDAENCFNEYVKDNENNTSKKFKMNKVITLIKDLQNAIPANDKELFYMKYKNLMENLNNI